MGIELPPELAAVAAQAGVVWPEADEDKMARSAQAWRDAATSMSTLTTDADTTARAALSTVSSGAGDKASTAWKSFVEPDSGHLTATVRGCTEAADRLEHAATQVGAAKVEIVRNLVGLAQNADAAHAAASAGHPTALAGLDTAVRGTAANVAHIESQLVSAVQPTSAVDMASVQNPVNPNPGTHSPSLLAGITATATDLTGAVADTTQGATNLVGNTAQGATNLVGSTAHGATDLVGNTAQGATNLVGDPGGLGETVRGTTDLVGNTAHGATNLVGDTAHHGADLVGNTGQDVTSAVGGTANAVGDTVNHGGDIVHDVTEGRPGDLLPGDRPGNLDPVPRDPDITGPVPGDHFSDDTPTPPTGQTVQAGFAGGLEPSAAPANLPPAAVAPPLAPQAPAAPNYGGAPAFGGTPGFGGVPGAPSFGAPGGVPGGAPVGAPVGAPLAGAPAPAATAGQQPAANRQAVVPAPESAPRKPMAGPPGAPPPSRGERDQVLALFWIHMFPIGHLPVASYRPARQLPPPPAELDYAAGLRFEPADHPDFAMIDGTARLAEIRAAEEERAAAKAAKAAADAAPIPLPPSAPLPVPPGYPPPAYQPAAAYPPAPGAPYTPGPAGPYSPAPPSAPEAPPAGRHALEDPPADTPTTEPGQPATHATVQALLEAHDPLGAGNERDWDRRYLVRFGSVTPQGISADGVEYNWPTSEQYPEGGSAAGDPEILAEDTVIDRFGTPAGRVFAADGTLFAQRSLPPAHKDAGYRRYRVTKPLPVWRAVSAAWFGQPGGGVRYRTTHSAAELVALGYLTEENA